ncbi:MAG: hypothetical protein ACYDBI_09515 [Thermoplasmataceae archaeon]
MELSRGNAKLTIIDSSHMVKFMRIFPMKIGTFSFVKKIANAMKHAEYHFEIRNTNSLLIEMGRGVRSITGDVRFKLFEIRKYLKN